MMAAIQRAIFLLAFLVTITNYEIIAGRLWGFLLLLPVIIAIMLLLSTKYRGKTFFEQTEPIAENIRDKQFLRSLALTAISLVVLGVGAYLLIEETRYNYGSYHWDEPVAQDTSMVVEEVADSVVAAPIEEEAAPEEAVRRSIR